MKKLITWYRKILKYPNHSRIYLIKICWKKLKKFFGDNWIINGKKFFDSEINPETGNTFDEDIVANLLREAMYGKNYRGTKIN